MELSNLLKGLYHKDIECTKTNLGLTNTIYKATIDGMKVAIRVPNDDIHHLIVHDEKKILDLIKTTDLDVDEIYYDKKTHIRITRWIDGAKTFSECHDIDKDMRAVTLIKKLHGHRFKVNDVFDPKKLYLDFKSLVTHRLYDYERYEDLFDDYEKIDHELILCHNDLVSGNFLLKDGCDHLIDYEYAAMNDPFFDLMSFISENNIDDIDRRNAIIFSYLEREPSHKERIELHITEMMMDLLWAMWANMLYCTRKEDVYLEIAEDKYAHLSRGITK